MIDYIALALGHGLLAIALLRLVTRAGLDADPFIAELKSAAENNRKAGKAVRRAPKSGEHTGEGNRETGA